MSDIPTNVIAMSLSDQGPDKFLAGVKRAVIESERNMGPKYTIDDIYIVWFTKVLSNHKALISTDVNPGLYWEVTFNGNRNEYYVDRYTKYSNTVVTIKEYK